MQLFVILLSVAGVLALSSASTTQRPIETTVTEEVLDVQIDDDDFAGDNDVNDDGEDEYETDDEDSDGEDDGSEYLDGINVDMLSDDELESLLEAEDKQLAGYLDVYVGAQDLQQRVSQIQTGVRRKRWVPLAIGAGRLAFSAGRALFSRFAARGITRSGARITKHYSRPGNYFTGLREFRNLNPTNVKRIGGSKFNGWTGTTGNYRVTVRSGSRGTTGANGSPTLSISSKGGDLVRKFRFD